MSNPLVEGEDYYWNEQGYVVLTEKHQLKRGYCCGMGCKHCPYDYEAVPEPRRSELRDVNRESSIGSRDSEMGNADAKNKKG